MFHPRPIPFTDFILSLGFKKLQSKDVRDISIDQPVLLSSIREFAGPLLEPRNDNEQMIQPVIHSTLCAQLFQQVLLLAKPSLL